jgi:metacaspase-1
MKKFFLIIAFLFSVVGFAQNKIGLIVAVGKYPEGGRWRDLSSENDVRYIKAALAKNGFDMRNVDSLLNEKATRKNIMAALEALYNKANEGDIVVFHFSGHGQQIEDTNGDEGDGYDEALIPYDAGAMYDPVNYKGQNHLRDDELQAELTRIRTKIGTKGSLIVLVDACHSGTISRGTQFAIARGEPIPFQSPQYKPQLKKNATDLDGFTEGSSSLGNMIVFSASSPNQVNYETKDAENNGVGSLSLAFSKAINDLPENTNYYLLFQKIKALIQASYPTQIPMVEGDLYQQVFSGAYTKRNEVLGISKWLNDSTFIVNAGSIDNVNKGSTFKVFNLTGNDVLTEGKITVVNIFQSAGIIKKRIDKSQAYQIKWDAMNQGAFSASLFINTHSSPNKQIAALKTQLTDLIKSYPFLSIDNNADYMLDVNAKPGNLAELSLVDKSDSTRLKMDIAGGQLSEEDKKQLISHIKSAIRVKYLRSLNDGGSLVEGVKLELIPKNPPTNPNELFLNPEDEFSIRITNNSGYKLYYTIIDIMPDNEAKVLVPEETATPQDYVLAAGQSFTIEGIQVDPGTPKGREFFKVIFAKSALDLRSVFNRTKTRSRNDLSSFEKAMDDMFEEANDKMTTRSSIGNVKVDEVGILTTGFTVSAK